VAAPNITQAGVKTRNGNRMGPNITSFRVLSMIALLAGG